jgi:hypothetical protein
MIAWVEEPVRKRFHVDTMPLDLSVIASITRPETDWVRRKLFSGNEVLLPPGTRLGEEADGSWTLLNANGTPTASRMPKGGFYFVDPEKVV